MFIYLISDRLECWAGSSVVVTLASHEITESARGQGFKSPPVHSTLDGNFAVRTLDLHDRDCQTNVKVISLTALAKIYFFCSQGFS